MSGERTGCGCSIEELLRATCKTASVLPGVSGVAVFVVEAEDSPRLRLAARWRGRGKEEPPGDVVWGISEGPWAASLRAGEVVTGDAAAARSFLPISLLSDAEGFVAAPMVHRGAFSGVLVVGTVSRPAAETLAVIEGTARQAALALASMGAADQYREEADVARILLDFSQALGAQLDEGQLWEEVVRRGRRVLGMEWSIGVRWDEQRAVFRLAAGSGLPRAVVESLAGAHFRLEDDPILGELISRREVTVADESWVRYRTTPQGWQVGQWLIVPLVRGTWVAGFLTAGYYRRDASITRRQLRLAEGMGHHGSIALQNAQLVARLEAADRLKSQFVSAVSHELRTPLNVILGYAEMLRDGAAGELAPDQRGMVSRLEARARELAELIDATLQVGRLQAGRDVVEIVPVPLASLLRSLEASTLGLVRPGDVALEWDLPDEPRGTVSTDPGKVGLVVRNLVGNAFKFTSTGKVVVRVRPQGNSVVIEVRDTGIGIPPEQQPVIFDMFRQLNGRSKRAGAGIGLGLYIVKQFVGRLGGAVDVESAPGRGSTFRVVLPGYTCEAGEAASPVS